jgi:hypothetical protein
LGAARLVACALRYSPSAARLSYAV